MGVLTNNRYFGGLTRDNENYYLGIIGGIITAIDGGMATVTDITGASLSITDGDVLYILNTVGSGTISSLSINSTTYSIIDGTSTIDKYLVFQATIFRPANGNNTVAIGNNKPIYTSKIILTSDSYGTERPTSGVEGQLFFHISDQ